MQLVPLSAVPSQTVNVLLANQACAISVKQKSTGVYIDLYVSGVLIIGGVACLNKVVIVRSAYLGFVGDLAFYDTQGNSDPTSAGLGDRFVLVYLEADDIAAGAIR